MAVVTGGYAVHTAYRVKEGIKKNPNETIESAIVKSVETDIKAMKQFGKERFSFPNWN